MRIIVKNNGKIIILRIHLTGGYLQLQTFVIYQKLSFLNLDAHITSVICRGKYYSQLTLRIHHNAVPNLKSAFNIFQLLIPGFLFLFLRTDA